MSKEPAGSARQHAKVETFSMFGLTVRMGPVGLIVYAKDFLTAAKAVPDGAFAPARIFLVCRALELAFKAFLSLRGRSLEQMAGGPFGHNLENLLKEAEAQDLKSLMTLDERQRNEIIRSSDYYRGKAFEYLALAEAVEGYPGMPVAAILIEAATIIIAALDEPCLRAE